MPSRTSPSMAMRTIPERSTDAYGIGSAFLGPVLSIRSEAPYSSISMICEMYFPSRVRAPSVIEMRTKRMFVETKRQRYQVPGSARNPFSSRRWCQAMLSSL